MRLPKTATEDEVKEKETNLKHMWPLTDAMTDDP